MNHYTFRSLLLLLVLTASILRVTVSCAAEIANDGRSTVTSQISRFVLAKIQEAVADPAVNLKEVMRSVDSSATSVRSEKTVRRTLALISAVEGVNAKKISFKLSEPPSVLSTSHDIEIGIMVHFDILGGKLSSGIMTMQIGGVRVEDEVIRCSIHIGHIAVSMNPIGED